MSKTQEEDGTSQDDAELEELLEGEEIEQVTEEISQSSPKEFDDNALLEFLSQSKSVAPVLEQVVTEQNEIQLEGVASEAPKQNEEEETLDKNYTSTNNYEDSKKYEDSQTTRDTSVTTPVIDVLRNDSRSSLQEIKTGNQRDDYSVPKDLESTEGGNPHQSEYKLRRFK